MPFIILIPFILCIVALLRGTASQAFLNVYLPIFMLFPIYYWLKMAALPPIDVSQAVLIPLGIAMLFTELPRWRLSAMDLWMIIFIYTTYYADSHAGLGTAAVFDLFNSVTVLLVPYMAGKLLIEQPGARIPVIKRIVFLLFIASVIGAYEYRMGQNPFTVIWSRFFPGELFAWKTQIRWGWGRVSGPYGQSELAGIILLFGLILASYLNFYNVWEPKFAKAPWLPGTKAKVMTWVIGITLLMTQARGPWLGFLLAMPVALIGRSKRVLRSFILVACLGLIIGPTIYIALKQYVSTANSTSAEQESAAYRNHMLDGYTPIAKQGGAMGWGQHFPRLIGLDSIDNEYLLVALTQGWVGLLAFCLLGLQTLYNFAFVAVFGQSPEDRYFGWSMTGIAAGILLIIFTVFLGNQPLELYFLLAGWSQALRLGVRQNLVATTVSEENKNTFAFKQVYT